MVNRPDNLSYGRRLVLVGIGLVGLMFSVFSFVLVLELSLVMDPALQNPFMENLLTSAQTTPGLVNKIPAYWEYYYFTSQIVWQAWLIAIAVILLTAVTVALLSRYGKTKQVVSEYRRIQYAYELAREQQSKAEEKLARFEQQLIAAYEKSVDGFLLLDEEGLIRFVNESAIILLHKWSPSLKNTTKQPFLDLLPQLASTPAATELENALKSGTGWEGECKLGESNQWAQVRFLPTPLGVGVMLRDITTQKQPKDLLQISEALLQQTVTNLPLPVALLDSEWTYLLTSPKWSEQFGLPPHLKGQNHFSLLPNFPGDRQQLELKTNSGQMVLGRAEKFTLNDKEEYLDWQLSSWESTSGRKGGYLLQARLVTGEVEARQRAETERAQEKQLAYHDALTGLPNRQLFHDRLNMALAQAYRQLSKVTLMFLDLDGFKPINDTLGHAAGDLLLQQVAQRLKDCVRETDTVARLGGDEFTLVLTGIGSPESVERLANKIISRVAEPYDLNGKTANISTSVGISIYPTDGNVAQDLIKYADEAMYRAKQSGKNTFRFHQTATQGG